MLTRGVLIAFCLIMSILVFYIAADSRTSSGFTSFHGKTEIALISLSGSEQQYSWAVTGGFLCYDPSEPHPESVNAGLHDDSKDSKCGTAYGESDRKHFELPNSVSLSVIESSTLEVFVERVPPGITDAQFSSGRAPSHFLVIRKATSLNPAGCGIPEEGPVYLLSPSERIELWDDAELYVPLTESTLMPFSGQLLVGQPSSAQTPQQLKAGGVGVYRNLSQPPYASFLKFGSGGPQLVGETSILPGDVVSFLMHSGNCFAPASGFLKAQNDGDGPFIQVVASMRASEGKVFVTREAPGNAGVPSKIGIELQFGEAVLSHPFTALLGLMISALVVIKEASGIWGFSRPPAPPPLPSKSISGNAAYLVSSLTVYTVSYGTQTPCKGDSCDRICTIDEVAERLRLEKQRKNQGRDSSSFHDGTDTP